MNWRCFFNQAAVSGFKALVSARPATAGNIASQKNETEMFCYTKIAEKPFLNTSSPHRKEPS